MSSHKKTPLLLCAFLLGAACSADEKPWREIRSPHFRIITNGSEKSGRHVAREFEQMRNVFATQFPTLRLDSPAPLLIFAPVDEYTTKQLLPQFWTLKLTKPAGVYFHGWERQFAVVRLDVIGSDRVDPDMYSTVYHEYVHSLLHLNFHWLPTWLDEGLAQFYGYTRFEGKETYLGAPPKNPGRLRILDRRVSTPLETFLSQRGSLSRNDLDTALFYAQSWALTHYLTLGPGMGKGAKLVRFFNALQAGTEQKKAFVEAFGPLEQVQKGFDEYVSQFAFPAGIIPSPPQADDSDYPARLMSVPETEAEIATFYAGTNQRKLALEPAQNAVKGDPKIALAHETLGFLAFNEGHDQEAQSEFSKAVELDPKMYLSQFAKTMMSPLSSTASPADRDLRRKELMKILDVNPQFSPAFAELARLLFVDRNFGQALAMARAAENYEPSRSGYHVLTGRLLLATGHPTEAAAKAAFVANRWYGPDRDEAMELWNSIPSAQRSAATVPDSPAASDMSAEGTIKSVSCADPFMTLTIDQAGQPLTFRYDFHHGMLGFSDTFWVGPHFTPCFHTLGVRAVVRYKPAADKSLAGDAMNIGFRDDLPAPVPAPEKTLPHPDSAANSK